MTSRPWFRERSNWIGKGTRIHPTAILEGCIVGGRRSGRGHSLTFAAAVIGDRAVIREQSALDTSLMSEQDAFLEG